MKARIFFLLITILTFPATVLAVDLYVSYEARGVFLQENKIVVGEAFNGVQGNPTLTFEPDYSYRFGLGVAFDEIFDIRVFYDELQNKSKGHDNQFAHSYPLARKFGELRVHPTDDTKIGRQGNTYASIVDGLEFGTGSATNEFGFKIFDLESGLNFKLDRGISIRLMFGGRYAKYEQTTWVIRGDECRPPRFHRERQRSVCPKGGKDAYGKKTAFGGSERHIDQKIDGFGPRFGLSIAIPIKNTNLSLINSSNYSILFAQKDVHDTFKRNKTHYQEVMDKSDPANPISFDPKKFKGTTTDVQSPLYRSFGIDDNNDIWSSNENVIIRNFSHESALQYHLKISDETSILFTAGYKYSIHFGALNSYGESLKDDQGGVTAGRYPHALGGKYGDKEDNLVSHGPFIKIGFIF